MSFFEKALRFALALGLLVGLVLFSVLLYVSDFGGTRTPPGQAAPARAQQAQGPATPEMQASDPARSALQWVFGAPKNTDTTTP
jgi:hypothetical protein